MGLKRVISSVWDRTGGQRDIDMSLETHTRWRLFLSVISCDVFGFVMKVKIAS